MANAPFSLLIDIAANTAKLREGFDDASAQVAKFGESIKSMAAGLAGGLAAAFSVSKIIEFADQVAGVGVKAQETAQRLKLTAEQVQALQVVSQRTGISMDELAKAGKANSDWLQQVTEDAKRAGLVIDNEYTASLKRMRDESDEATKRIQAFFAPAVTATKSWIAEGLERIADDLKTIGSMEGVVDKLIALFHMLGYGGGPGAAGQFRIDEFERVARNAQEVLDRVSKPRQTGIGTVQPDPADVAAARKARDDALTRLGQERDRAARAAYGDTLTTLPPQPVTATRIGGGGARTGVDAYTRELEALKAQQDAVKAGITELAGATGMASREAERLAQLQIDIGVKQAEALRKAHTTDPQQVQAIKDEAERLVKLKFEYEGLKQTIATADAVHKKFGDGQKELADRLFYLKKAFDDNRISVDEYTNAVKVAREEQSLQADKAKEFTTGLEGISAGFSYAAKQSTRLGADFQVGQELFTNSMQLMSNAITEFAQTGQIQFGKLAQSFAAMLAQMALQAAASKIIGLVVKLVGSAFAPSISGAGIPGETGMNAFLTPGLQHGGPVMPGRPYWVGEAGPELFVPNAAGRIEPKVGHIEPAGAAAPKVTINNYGADVTAQREPDGGLAVTVRAVRRALSRDVRSGGNEFAASLERAYGVSRGGA